MGTEKLPIIGLICLIISLSCLLILQIRKNEKYIKTINLLIDDEFVNAEKYIKDNNLFKDINYDILVKKINTQIKLRLLNRTENGDFNEGKYIQLSNDMYCKRFNVEADICKNK